MTAVVSVSRAAGAEPCYAVSAPLAFHENCEQGKSENWAMEKRSESEVDPRNGEQAMNSESSYRAEDEPTVLSPEEISSRLDRTHREFHNRRKIIIKNLPADITNQASVQGAINRRARHYILPVII